MDRPGGDFRPVIGLSQVKQVQVGFINPPKCRTFLWWGCCVKKSHGLRATPMQKMWTQRKQMRLNGSICVPKRSCMRWWFCFMCIRIFLFLLVLGLNSVLVRSILCALVTVFFTKKKKIKCNRQFECGEKQEKIYFIFLREESSSPLIDMAFSSFVWKKHRLL